MKLKLADHHIADIKDDVDGMSDVKDLREDIHLLLEHIDALTEELNEKQELLNSLPPSGELCPKTDDCDRPTGHTGRCNHNGKVEAE